MHERHCNVESDAIEFVLQEVQPALLGLMDGSVSALAPIFATAGLTGRPMSAFFVGLAASLGAGLSMGLSEALSDDGTVTGRGGPVRAARSPVSRRRSEECCTRFRSRFRISLSMDECPAPNIDTADGYATLKRAKDNPGAVVMQAGNTAAIQARRT